MSASPTFGAIVDFGRRIPYETPDSMTQHGMPTMSDQPWIGATQGRWDFPHHPDRGRITASMIRRPLFDLLAERASRDGSATACVDETRVLTYGMLYDAVRRFALAIIAAAADPGPIAILSRDGIDTIVALFAATASGRPCLILDATHPRERNGALLRQTGVVLIVGERDAPADEATPPTIAIARAYSDQPIPTHSAPRPLGADEPAFIVATSGSTGQPKAFALSQRIVLGRAEVHVNAVTRGAGDVVACLSSAAVVGGLYTLIGFPIAGVPVRCVDLARGGFRALFELCRSGRITILRAGVSTLRAIATLPDAAGALAGLRNVTAYGETLTRADTALLASVLPTDCSIFTAYGSTETPGTFWYARPDDDHDPVRIPAGYIRNDVEILIVDPDGRPVPIGEVGELWVRSPYVALGLWQAGGVVPGSQPRDPGDPDKRVHRTGDLARITQDGVVVILGRKDRMAQINGQRVEPAEVEAALRAAPGVTEAVVVIRADAERHWLHGFVVLSQGLVDDVRKALRQTLPSHMIPARITALPTMPMLPTGKPDTARLLEHP